MLDLVFDITQVLVYTIWAPHYLSVIGSFRAIRQT